MSAATLKAAATGQTIATIEKPKTIASLLTDPNIKQQMALALPKHMTADRLARIALTEVRKNPKLAQCDQTSFLGAIMQLAALGLEPGGALGHAYLLPFDKREKVNGQWKTVSTEVQLIVGYRGMIDLARRSGQIQSIEARAVYAKDSFGVRLGLDSSIEHVPAWDEVDRGELTFVYAVAKLKDGGVQFDVMSRAEIEKIRARSKAGANGPWVSDFEEMAKKTVLRRLFKYLPVSIEMQRAVGLDEQAAAGIDQGNGLVIDGNYERVTRAEDEPQYSLDAPITKDEVIAAIINSEDLDELDAAADMIRMLPEADRKEAKEEYRLRRVSLVEAQ